MPPLDVQRPRYKAGRKRGGDNPSGFRERNRSLLRIFRPGRQECHRGACPNWQPRVPLASRARRFIIFF